ncbi:MAG: hypothetical protein ACNA7U_06120, partial [Candidatus Izemoplasmataceae bacterium]
MLKKIVLIALTLMVVVILSACRKQPTTDNNDPVIVDLGIKEVIGLEHGDFIVNEYFNPLRDVLVKNQSGENITHYLKVNGFVHYGKVGTYNLHYSMTYGEDTIDITRTINIIEGTIVKETNTRNIFSPSTVTVGEGSYKTGGDASIDHPVNPLFIEPYLLDKAVPSNGWWTSLLVQNYGGGNGIYTNPFRSSFSSAGVEVTNNGVGFVQYWNPDGYNTMANFALALPDFHMKSSDLSTEYRTQVVDYSDTTVSVAMRNNQSLADQMVVTYTQGSPYIFVELANEKSPFIRLASNGVSSYEFYTVDGIRINGTSYVGDGIIIKLVQKHIGYQTSRPAQVGQPNYGDRYFLVSTPNGTSFTFSNDNHPFGLNNKISMELNEGNYYSVASLQSISEAVYYHTHAFNKPLKGDVSYVVDYQKSEVITTYQTAYQSLNNNDESSLLQFLMPHHYQQIVDNNLTDYSMRTIRGTMKLLEGNQFQTALSFHGVLPAMTKPNSSAFDETLMTEYLQDLASRTE